MESTKGYVYIMINPSMEGLLKIGKTTREPEERAKELSAVTGVATPFVVVYKRHFNNCHNAENAIHSILEQMGCRVNDQREFFSIDITNAINLLMSIDDCKSDYIDEDIEEESPNSLAESFYQKAECYYYGVEHTFQDTNKALEYYKKAASLGHIEAYGMIGEILYMQKGKVQKAIEAYQKAIELGGFWYYKDLAFIYSMEDRNNYNEELAWELFFKEASKHNLSPMIPQVYDALKHFYSVNHFCFYTKLEQRKPIYRKYKEALISITESEIEEFQNEPTLLPSIKEFLEFLKCDL